MKADEKLDYETPGASPAESSPHLRLWWMILVGIVLVVCGIMCAPQD